MTVRTVDTSVVFPLSVDARSVGAQHHLPLPYVHTVEDSKRLAVPETEQHTAGTCPQQHYRHYRRSAGWKGSRMPRTCQTGAQLALFGLEVRRES